MTIKVSGRSSTDIRLDGLDGATYNRLDKFLDGYGSAGIFEGGLITDSGSGQIDVSAAKGLIRTTNSELGKLVAFNIEAGTNIDLTDNSMNYVYISYNGGSPVFAVTTSYGDISLNDEVICGRVYRLGTLLYISNVGQDIQNATLRDLYRLQTLRRLEWASGSLLSFTAATRQPYVSAGIFFSNYAKVVSAIFDASGADRFTAWYRNGTGGWTAVTSQQNVDNVNYDDGDGTLANLGVGDHGVHWVYILADGSVHIQYGQATYTSLANARNSTVPSTQPTPVTGMGILIGRLIIAKNASTIYEASSAFSYTFTGTATTSHNDLAGLQGGTAGEYYHLTAADYTVRNLPVVEVTGTSQQAVIRTRYIANNAALVTVTLPATAAVGDFVEVEGYGAGGWQIAQNASQSIRFLGVVSTTGITGYIASTTQYDSVHLRCVVASTGWEVINAVGELDVI